MRDAYEEIKNRNARLVVIGNGRPEQARAFRETEGITFDLWVDTEMKAYRAAGLRRDPGGILSPRILGHVLRALRGGFRQTGIQGDPWQLGGAFVISSQGKTVFEQVSREAGDHASLPELLRALDRLQGGSPRSTC